MQMDLFKSKKQITKEEGKVCKKCNVYLPLTAYAWRGNEGFQSVFTKRSLYNRGVLSTMERGRYAKAIQFKTK
jgi:hypothetical protein